jgi:hypothetical protein
MATYEVGAHKDRMAERFEAAGLSGRGFQAIYRPKGGKWKACLEDRGAEGVCIIWRETAEQAKAAAKEWLRKRAARVRRGGGVATS